MPNPAFTNTTVTSYRNVTPEQFKAFFDNTVLFSVDEVKGFLAANSQLSSSTDPAEVKQATIDRVFNLVFSFENRFLEESISLLKETIEKSPDDAEAQLKLAQYEARLQAFAELSKLLNK